MREKLHLTADGVSAQRSRVALCVVPQVELFEFRGEDLTEEEDGGIIRRIRTRGEGYARPNEGAIVEGETV